MEGKMYMNFGILIDKKVNNFTKDIIARIVPKLQAEGYIHLCRNSSADNLVSSRADYRFERGRYYKNMSKEAGKIMAFFTTLNSKHKPVLLLFGDERMKQLTLTTDKDILANKIEELNLEHVLILATRFDFDIVLLGMKEEDLLGISLLREWLKWNIEGEEGFLYEKK